MIRQAISCDICGAEKKQTNHWFVACEQGGELRVSGWGSRNRLKTGSKHLCGQTCLHKLVDEFMARAIAGRAAVGAQEAAMSEMQAETDASLTSEAAYAKAGSGMGVPVTQPETGPTRAPVQPVAAACSVILPMVPRLLADNAPTPAFPPQEEEPPVYSSRRWRAEAWERERSRELRAIDYHPDIARRRKSV